MNFHCIQDGSFSYLTFHLKKAFKFRTFAAEMISINNLTFLIGSRALYDDANWHIKPGDRAGLIGANGTGKSTLLKIIVGEYAPSSGTVSMSKDLKIGYLNQDLLSYDSHHSILHVAMEAFERQNQLHDEIEELLKKIETDYSEEVLFKLSDKQQEFEALDGYNIEYRANEILAGLGFSTADQLRPLNTFSGGWRMRVMLAKILLQTPDILLLDEPTNHMDLPSIKWLENYLMGFEGAIVIVSHDRYFLDNVANKIWFIEGGKIKQYPGTYAEYEEWNSKRVIPAPKPIPVKMPEKQKEEPKPITPNTANQLKKLNDELQKTEKLITELEQNVKNIEAELADENVYAKADKLAEANKRYLATKQELDNSQGKWESLAAEIMELEG
jgi:ATP-binding cassette subfamily F protein 3